MSSSVSLKHLHPDQVTPAAGSFVTPDEWPGGAHLWAEDQWDKAEFRIPTGHRSISSLAVNVTVTGRKAHWRYHSWRVRVKIEFVGDCEPSTFSGGWLYIGDRLSWSF